MLEFHSSVLSAAVILYRDGFQMTAKKLHDSLCNFILTFFKDETVILFPGGAGFPHPIVELTLSRWYQIGKWCQSMPSIESITFFFLISQLLLDN